MVLRQAVRLLMAAMLSTACGSGGKSAGKGAGAAAAAGRTVVIIDDGFDASAPVLQGKIKASFTVSCPDASSDKLDWDALSPADLKQQVLAGIQAKSPCTLTPTLEFNRSTAFGGIEANRDAWNKGILTKAGVALDQTQIAAITDVLGGESGKYDYHGTATAGTIAYANPNVRLVLVQFKLKNEGQVKTAIACHHQAGVDKFVATFQDPEVLNAYVTAPPDPASAQLNQIAADQGVTIASLSLGGLARTTLEQVYASKGCGTVDLSAYFKLQRDLSDKRNAYLTQKGLNGPNILTVQAAGNDGASAMTPADSEQCSDPTNDVVIVGSYDAAHKRSTFSNYGDCVDVYSLGDNVVVAAPDGFVNVESGTSFSTPMVVRHLTLTAPAAATVKDLAKALLGEADAAHDLAPTTYPEEVAFADKGVPVAAYSLAGEPQPTPAQWQRARAAGALRQWLLPWGSSR